ncbi:MAG: hypothetical protein ACREAR_04405 [Nitrosotalea sp.]
MCKAYTLINFHDILQIKKLSHEKQFEVVGNVLPFKTNCVVEQLVNWKAVPDDPMFILNFPQKDVLTPKHYLAMARALKKPREKRNPENCQQNKITIKSASCWPGGTTKLMRQCL